MHKESFPNFTTTYFFYMWSESDLFEYNNFLQTVAIAHA